MSDLKAGIIAGTGIAGMVAIAAFPIGAITFPVWAIAGVGAVGIGAVAGVTARNIKKNK